ncbi:MAG: hypothetical protein AAF587_15025 [Bacteroidota bacterium]
MFDVKGALDSLINFVPGTDELTFMPFQEVSVVPIPVGAPYVVQFNPESYSLSDRFNYDSSQAMGRTGSSNRFNNIAPKEFSFEFMVDGTGATGERINVQDNIDQFKNTIGFNGSIHRPNILFVVWGTFKAICVATSANYNFTLFKSDGTPLRAKVSVRLREYTPAVVELLQNQLQSPDLSEIRTIKEGDKLPLMCFHVYGNSRRYLEVARANGLTSCRRLQAGEELDFPPEEK